MKKTVKKKFIKDKDPTASLYMHHPKSFKNQFAWRNRTQLLKILRSDDPVLNIHQIHLKLEPILEK